MMGDWMEQVKALIDSKATNVVFLVTPDETRVKDLVMRFAENYAVIAAYDPYRGLELLKGKIDAYEDFSSCSPLNPLEYIQKFESVMRTAQSLFIFYNANRLVKDLQFNLLWPSILSIRRKTENYLKLSGMIFVFSAAEDIDAEVLQKTFAVKTGLPSREDFAEVMHIANTELKKQKRKEILISEGDLTGLLNSASGMTLTQFENVLFYLYKLNDGNVSVNEVMNEKAKIVEASGLITINRSKYTLADYAGQDEIKAFLDTRVINIIKEAERAGKLGVRIPRGIAFVGNPRTGKTFLGNCLSGSLRMPVFQIQGSSLTSKWYGEAEQLTSRAIEQIDKNSPCAILWDEPEGWLGSREGGMHEASLKTLGLWLAYLGKTDRNNLFLIMTNRPDMIDNAILSAGRVDYVIPFLLPDSKQREAVLTMQFKRIQKIPYNDKLDFATIARETEHFNCAELENVVRESALNAFQRKADKVEMGDVMNALEIVKVPLERRDKEEKFYRALAVKYCNVPTLMKGVDMNKDEVETAVKDYSRWV